MLTAGSIRRRIEWLVPKGNLGDTLTYLSPPWPEEYAMRWEDYACAGLTLSRNGRAFVDELARVLAEGGARLQEIEHGEYAEYSPAVQLLMWPQCSSESQIWYVLSKIVDVAYGAAVRRDGGSLSGRVPIESVLPEHQEEHATVLRVMGEFGVEYRPHDDPIFFEECEGYSMYCERTSLRTVTACIGEIIFYDSLYDASLPVRF